MASSESAPPSGWYVDPAGRHELRYWDGSQWTEHVATGSRQSVDPPVSDPANPQAEARQAAMAAARGKPAPGWYDDPTGKFNLRYWDGSTWTEHVS